LPCLDGRIPFYIQSPILKQSVCAIIPSGSPSIRVLPYQAFGLDIKREALPIPLVKVVGEALDVEKADPILAGGSKLIDVKHGLRAGLTKDFVLDMETGT
jgi:hypothetical protein